MPFKKKNESYTVYFGKEPNPDLARRIGLVMAILSACILILYFNLVYFNLGDLEDIGALLSCWYMLLIFALMLCYALLHPGNPDYQIIVSGECFQVIENRKAKEVHHFSEITHVRIARAFVPGGRTISLGDPRWEIYIGNECVAVYWAEMKNSWKLDKKLHEIGRLRNDQLYMNLKEIDVSLSREQNDGDS